MEDKEKATPVTPDEIEEAFQQHLTERNKEKTA